MRRRLLGVWLMAALIPWGGCTLDLPPYEAPHETPPDGGPPDGGSPDGGCLAFGSADDRGPIEHPALLEVSGLAASHQSDQVLWAHNDEDDPSHLYAMKTDGADLGVYDLVTSDGTPLVGTDFEDVAIGPGPGPEAGASYLYLGDLGTAGGNRIYRAVEPAVSPDQDPQVARQLTVEVFPFTYPAGAPTARALFLDPATHDLFIVEAVEADGPTRIYRFPAPLVPDVELEQVAVIQLGVAPLAPSVADVTGAAVSADGTELILRTVDEVWLWQWPSGLGVAELLLRPPCPRFDLRAAAEPSGQAVTFARDGSGFFTLSEGSGHQPLFFYPRLSP